MNSHPLHHRRDLVSLLVLLCGACASNSSVPSRSDGGVVVIDSGFRFDGGDGGPPGFDVGPQRDAGPRVDAGGADAGRPFDTGPGFDGGPIAPGAEAARHTAAVQNVTSIFCACEVEAGLYPSLDACFADSDLAGPTEIACAQRVLDAVGDGATLSCFTATLESFIACTRTIPCSDINGEAIMLNRCEDMLDDGQAMCRPFNPATGPMLDACGF